MERVLTAKLPGKLVSRLDEVTARIERSKSWIVRQVLAEWLKSNVAMNSRLKHSRLSMRGD